jgi:hypothetical protein
MTKALDFAMFQVQVKSGYLFAQQARLEIQRVQEKRDNGQSVFVHLFVSALNETLETQ